MVCCRCFGLSNWALLLIFWLFWLSNFFGHFLTNLVNFFLIFWSARVQKRAQSFAFVQREVRKNWPWLLWLFRSSVLRRLNFECFVASDSTSSSSPSSSFSSVDASSPFCRRFCRSHVFRRFRRQTTTKKFHQRRSLRRRSRRRHRI